MKGIIKDVHYFASKPGDNGGGIATIWIVGDDGNEYFGHGNEFIRKNKHYKKGRSVTFDAIDNGTAHQDAINIDVEIPAAPENKQDEFLGLVRLPDGAYIKRLRKPDGKELSLIIKDGELIISSLSVFERDMVWMYQRGPSGLYK